MLQNGHNLHMRTMLNQNNKYYTVHNNNTENNNTENKLTGILFARSFPIGSGNLGEEVEPFWVLK